ncbi:MAG: hypothetical protein F7C38_03995 [Desulfurococcales archaeon]|nr:hypothetical protein [Desulfurococcales archaeon]
MAGPDSEAVEKALSKAEEAARHVIENALGQRISYYNISLKATYSVEGPERLVIDIHLARPRVERKMLHEVIEAAIEAARQAFETELSKKVDSRANR